MLFSFLSGVNDYWNINNNRWWMDSSIIYRILLIFLFLISPAHTIEFQGKFLQGHFILGKTNPKATIFVGKKEVKVSKDGGFRFWN